MTLASSHIATTLMSVTLALICPLDPQTFRKQLPGRPHRDLVLSMCRTEHTISTPSTPMSQGRLSSQDLGSHPMALPSYLHSLAKSCQSVPSTHFFVSPATTGGLQPLSLHQTIAVTAYMIFLLLTSSNPFTLVMCYFCIFLSICFLKNFFLIYFWLCWVDAVRRLSLIVCGLLIAMASLVAEHRLQGHGFMGPRAWAQQLWGPSLVAPRHVEFSWTRD